MINPDSVNYSALYSFEPDFLRQVNDDTPSHEEQDEDSSKPGTMDTVWSGVLVFLVLMLMIGLINSLTTSASTDSISRLSGAGVTTTTKHVPHALHYQTP